MTGVVDRSKPANHLLDVGGKEGQYA